jgi:hypothetical protein
MKRSRAGEGPSTQHSSKESGHGAIQQEAESSVGNHRTRSTSLPPDNAREMINLIISDGTIPWEFKWSATSRTPRTFQVEGQRAGEILTLNHHSTQLQNNPSVFMAPMPPASPQRRSNAQQGARKRQKQGPRKGKAEAARRFSERLLQRVCPFPNTKRFLTDE